MIRPHDPAVISITSRARLAAAMRRVDRDFFKRVTEAVSGAGAIMIAGPASAKTEFAAHIAAHAPDLSARVSTVEAANHPSDGELMALACKFFQTNDRMKTPA